MKSKLFECRETGESLTLFDYEPSLSSSSVFRGLRDESPIILRLSPATVEDQSVFSQLFLCPGWSESQVLENNQSSDLLQLLQSCLIEKVGDIIVYRSRSCHQLVLNQNSCCQDCRNLVQHQAVNEKEERENIRMKDEMNSDDEDSENEKMNDSIEDDDEDKDFSPKTIGIIKRKEPAKSKQKPQITSYLPQPRTVEEKSQLESSLIADHVGERTCKICGLTYERQCALNAHIRRKHISTEEELHMKKKYGCDYCSDRFKTKAFLKQHMKISHKNIKQVKDDDFEEKSKTMAIEKCPLCGDVMKSRNLLNHVLNEHSNEKDNPLFQEVLESKSKTFVCSQCGEAFKNDACLNFHMRKKHPETASQNFPFSCNVCGCHFKTSIYLYTHTKLVHEEDEVLCNICGESCKNKYVLKRHIARRHNSQTCLECGRQFKDKSTLSQHMKFAHLNIIEYPCPSCDKQFIDKKGLRRHILSVHDKIKPYYCEVCGFQSARSDNLNLHRRKSHQIETSFSKSDYIKFVESGQNPYCEQIDHDLFVQLR